MARVLLVVTSATTVHAFCRPIVASLEAAGHEVLVACGDDGKGAPEGLRVVDVPFARSGSPLNVARATLGLARVTRDWRPDAVVCATPVASFLGVCVARLLRVPTVLYLAWGLRSETLHGVARRVVGAAESATARLAHLVLANSPSLEQTIKATVPRAAARVECLGAGSSHGVDIEAFHPGGRERERPRIGFIGRIRRDKGVAELLEATASMWQKGMVFELELTGELEDDSLKGALETHPVVVVRPPTPDIPEVMRGLDILCLPSWREGFPNVVLEASATALPVVTTNATGARDSVRDGLTGIVVEVRDSDALEEALTRLLNDRGLRASMGVAGRAWVEEHFERAEVCERLAARISGQMAASR